jgi:hypothetical protein
MSDAVLIPAIVIAFTACFAAMWIGITSLLGRLSGWNALARAFPDTPDRPVDTLRFRSARMGVVNYSSCLRLDICPTGLRVSVLRLLGPFQRSFFVPWNQISVEPGFDLLIRAVRLTFGPRGEGSLTISRGTFDRIAANSPCRRPEAFPSLIATKPP